MDLRECKIGNFKLKIQEILKYVESLSYQAFAYSMWQGIAIKDLQMPKIIQKEKLHSYYIFYH